MKDFASQAEARKWAATNAQGDVCVLVSYGSRVMWHWLVNTVAYGWHTHRHEQSHPARARADSQMALMF